MSVIPEFEAWPKVPRLRQTIIVTEKIDGTNAAVGVRRVSPTDYPDLVGDHETVIETESGVYAVRCQSRKRFVTPKDDNYGFASWAIQNAAFLTEHLGEGLHFGEWWGVGVQRGYNLRERRFSLFNTRRWGWLNPDGEAEFSVEREALHEVGVHCVPVLGIWGELSSDWIQTRLDTLSHFGSVAAPGFMDPEGVVVFHPQSQQMFKKLIGKADELPKSVLAAQEAAA